MTAASKRLQGVQRSFKIMRTEPLHALGRTCVQLAESVSAGPVKGQAVKQHLPGLAQHARPVGNSLHAAPAQARLCYSNTPCSSDCPYAAGDKMRIRGL